VSLCVISQTRQASDQVDYFFFTGPITHCSFAFWSTLAGL